MASSRKGSVSPSDLTDNTVYVCHDCDKEVKEDAKALECELCSEWFHIKCQDVSTKTYNFLKESQAQIHWFCNTCNGGAINCLKIVSDVKLKQDAMAAQLSEVAGKVENMERKFDGIDGSIKDEFDKQALSVKEVLDRERRRLSLIIRNLPEDKDDTTTVNKMMADLGLQDVKLVDIERFGVDDSKPRFTRISVKSHSDKMRILKKSKDLRTKDYFKSVYVGPDLTREQRQQDKALRDELKRRREAGEEIKISKGKIVAIDGTACSPKK